MTPERASRTATFRRRRLAAAASETASIETAEGAVEPSPRLRRRWGSRRSPTPPARPGSLGTAETAAPAATPVASLLGASEPSTSWFGTFFGQTPAQPRGTLLPPLAGRAQIDAMIAHHAKLNGVPEALVHRIVIRESKYNPRAVGRGGAMGLMQIKTGTARALGYQGGPTGLLDAETNLTYGVKYLAGAYRTADGNHDRSVSNYARGYYYEAKRKGTLETADASQARPRRIRRSRAEALDVSPTTTLVSRSEDRPVR